MREDCKRLWRFLQIGRKHLVSYGVSSAIVSCRNLIINWLTAFISSQVISVVSRGSIENLFQQLISFLILLLTFSLFDSAGLYMQTISIQKIGNALRTCLYNGMLRASIPETERLGRRSEVINRMNQDVDTASNFLSGVLITPIMYIVSGIGATIIIARESPSVCVGLYLLGLIGLFVQTKISKKIRSVSQDMRNETTQGLSIYMQTISQSADIRIAGLRDMVASSFSRRMSNFRRLGHASSILNGVSVGFLEIVQYVGYFGTVGICLYLYINGSISLATVVMMSQMSSLILAMILSILSSINNIHNSLVGIDRVLEIADLPAENMCGSELCVPNNKGEKELVCAVNTSCQFSNGTTAFENLSITIPASGIVAICGDSGCGKTTLIRLLLKLYPYTGGNLMLLGQEIAECSAESIRKAVGYVPQENLIFSGTFRDNLLIGNTCADINDDEIWEVLEGVGAASWVYALNEGLDTLLSEGGQNLSGGQRQIIAIARAILSHRRVLIFDEAFAGVDAAHISKIIKCLGELPENRYVIIVTHDKQVAQLCTHKIVLSNDKNKN